MIRKIIFKNKKAAISVLEAFIAISVIIIIVSILIEQDSPKKDNIPERIYSAEVGILRNLQINETYRADIFNATVPVYWNNASFPSRVKEEIENKKPSYLDCRAKICEINQPCSIEEDIEGNVYAQSAFISANATTYAPRELKLFCWEKDALVLGDVEEDLEVEPVVSFSATGGTIAYTDSNGLNPRSSPAYVGGYTVHTFTSNGTLTVTGSGNVDYLVVAGGGGGGVGHAGGGGAGSVLYGTGFAVTAQVYSITVGGGGGAATNGANSVFSSITATGGGSGSSTGGTGGTGGSGGGASSHNAAGHGAGTSGQGYAGGHGVYAYYDWLYGGGGGGGASEEGHHANPEVDVNYGKGGAGVYYPISGTSVAYGGGGGGAWHNSNAGSYGCRAGGGGGGGGGDNINGINNTGGGGATNLNIGSGTGGSGIVVVRYLTTITTPPIPPTLSATGGTITYTDSNGLNPRSSPAYDGGYTVHTFTSNGTFNVTNSGNVEVLVVAGGGSGDGAGSWQFGAGGGAGGMCVHPSKAISAGSYTVTVGNGGIYPTGSGDDSAFLDIHTHGGGHAAVTGGSGGGGYSGTTYAATQDSPGGSTGYGYRGGSGSDGNAGGGGGAGGVGEDMYAGIGRASSITGSSVTYAAGGSAGQAGPGTANRGNGGGGGNVPEYGGPTAGGNGGSGIVIIRYLTTG